MKQETIAMPGQVAGGYIETSETPEAATLRALGVQPITCRVDHTAQNPLNSGRGQTFFALEGSSSTWNHQEGLTGNAKPMPTAMLRQAYKSRDGAPATELDDLIAQIASDELRVKIQNALPLAIASYGRAFEQQRQQCMA